MLMYFWIRGRTLRERLVFEDANLKTAQIALLFSRWKKKLITFDC